MFSHDTTDGHVRPYPGHTRNKPAVWDNLIESIDPLVSSYPQSDQTAQLVMGLVGELDDEVLDRNRYYALSGLSAELKLELSDPAKYYRVIQYASGTLVNRVEGRIFGSPSSKAQVGARLTLSDVENIRKDSWVKYPMMRAALHLSAPERLLGDALCLEADYRLADEVNKQCRTNLEGIKFGSELAVHSSGDAINGSTLAMTALYRHVYDTDIETDPIITAAELRSLPLDEVGGKMAVLPIRTFLSILDDDRFRHFQTNRRGRLSLDHTWATSCPASVQKVLHTETLGCPAINVPDLIPQIGGLICDSVEAAQVQLDQRQT